MMVAAAVSVSGPAVALSAMARDTRFVGGAKGRVRGEHTMRVTRKNARPATGEAMWMLG